MTTNLGILTAAHAVLAVPLDAIQRDSHGEFANRVGPSDALERVAVTSGAVSGDLVLVQGNRHPDHTVQVVQPKVTSSNPKSALNNKRPRPASEKIGGGPGRLRCMG